MEKTSTAQIETALQEWVSALDVLEDPIFIHDHAFRIHRCNRAYQRHAALPFDKIIGRPFFKIFPKMDTPPPHCIKALQEGTKGVVEDELRVGDTLFHSRAYAINDSEGRFLYSVHILENITLQRQAELQLRQERHFSDKLIETAPVIAVILDPKGRIVKFNRRMEQLSGYTFEEVKGTDWFDTFLPERSRAGTKQVFLEAINDIDTQGQIDSLVTRGGDVLQIEWYSKTIKGTDSRTEGLLAIGLDVTEQRKMLERLELFHALFEHSRDAVEVIEPGTLKLLDVNATLCRELGYRRDELLGMTAYDINPTITPDIVASLETRLGKEGNLSFESLHKRREGSIYPVEISLSLNDFENPSLLAIARDISARKEAEEALKESEEKFRTMTASAQDAILMMDQGGKISYWNEAAERMFGYAADEALGFVLHHLLAPERFRDAYRNGFRHFTQTGEGPAVGKTLELSALKNDGTEFPIELSLSSIGHKGEWHAIGIIRDISERKEAEAALNRANRALRTLSAGNLTLVRAASEEELLNNVTDVIVTSGGYSLVAVHFADTGAGKKLHTVAWAGSKGRKYWIQDLSWDATKRGNFPAGTAIREKQTQICRDIKNSACDSEWCKLAAKRGYHSNIALPLFDGDKVFGALSIYSTQSEPFDDEEVQLLEELAGDLAYGILNLRTRAAHERHEALLREGLEQTVQAIAATVESRDPYTAGHQKRVAELATAIAREMKLAEEQIEGIGFAAVIHDLGKIHIPAEILSKPGRLTDIEYKLIQTHPQAGYDIIKDVRFPWPIAQIILQHHECLDGSGYPLGLKGDAILIEARIIAVADVVEAISSHRPYRSALGIGPALEEIEKGRGALFDPDAVDACIRLFTQKQFAFTGASSMCQL